MRNSTENRNQNSSDSAPHVDAAYKSDLKGKKSSDMRAV